jgi:L-threonylcarbamoyladenylate synthase
MAASGPDIVAADAAGIDRAARALRRGELVAMPTETVYGLAGDATSPAAVARIFAAKERPHFNPLIAHVRDIEMASREGVLDERALSIVRAYWPGPLTLVVPVQRGVTVCELARAGLDSIALRVPAHPAARALIDTIDRPLVAPSANRSGHLSPTSAQDVVSELGAGVAVIVDGGRCEIGVESTIVAMMPDTPPTLLRPGAIPRRRLEKLLGQPLSAPDSRLQREGERIVAPGQLTSHYAPRALVRLNATQIRPGEVMLGFGPDAPAEAMNLSRSGDTTEAAANLYAMLRSLDATGAAVIAVMPLPAEDLGEAINDRLRRAASPR